MHETLHGVLPWVRFLPTAEVEQSVTGFASTFEGAAALGNITPVSQLLTE